MANEKQIANIDIILQDIEQSIVSGRVERAIEALSKISPKEVGHKYQALFSRLATRLDMPELALKFIWESVYSLDRATTEDVLACGQALRKLGLLNRAREMFSRVPGSAEAEIGMAFVEMTDWNSKKAAIHLLAALESETLSTSQRDLCRTNLAACWAAEDRFKDGLEETQRLRKSGINERNKQLALNLVAVEVQCLIGLGEFETAADIISEKSQQETELSPISRLFWDKWQLVLRLQNGEMSHDSAEINEFRRRCRKLNHWNSLRSIDLQIASLTKDQDLINSVYFGSPMASIKSALKNICTPWPVYVWADKRQPSNELVIHDSFDMPIEDLKLGLAVHRLFLVLCSDFYQSFSTELLFETLFSDEVYNPDSSKLRVYQLVKALKEAFESSDIDIEMVSTEKGYRLRPVGKHAFRVYPKMTFESQAHFVHYRLCQISRNRDYTKKELMNLIALSEPQWLRLLSKMTEEGLVEKSGSGRATMYHLISEVGD